MNLDFLAKKPCEWLKGTGPDSDIVISSRIRLARNLAGFNFSNRLLPEHRLKLIELVKNAIQKSPSLKKNTFFLLKDMNQLDRQFLLERHLVSVEFSSQKTERGPYAPH